MSFKLNTSARVHSSLEAELWHLKSTVFLLLVVLGIVYIAKGVRHRLFFRGLPGPPHSLLLGSLPALADVIKTTPSDTTFQHQSILLHRKHNLGGLFYLDSWPVTSDPLIVITDPDLAAQVTQKHSLPKHPIAKTFVGPIVGNSSMVIAEGAEWKAMRSMFNPGFSNTHLATLVPSIVDAGLIFCNVLSKQAESNKLFLMEELLTCLTVDIIGRVVLDIDLNSQITENELVTAFRKQVRWTPLAGLSLNPFVNWNPIRPIMQYYYTRKIDNYIIKVLDDRYASDKSKNKEKKSKATIDLALDQYRIQEETKGRPKDTNTAFKLAVVDQMKTFIFAGHDTTSSLICYVYYLLSLNPEKLATVRKEHDDVLGKDPTRAAEAIKAEPNLLNQIPYTLAVAKESLRMFPVASTTRQGDAQTSIIYNGQSYPTKGCMVTVNSHIMGRRADLFPSPDDFIPERFLPAPLNFQDIPKDAFRPFEKGPRNCIGQELALLEARVILALTLRTFDVVAAYEEWDRRLGREKPGETLDGKRGLLGYRMYQTFFATAKPTEGMPARVQKRTSTG